MSNEEAAKRISAYITCLKCEISGKECDVNCQVEYEAGTMGEIVEALETLIGSINLNQAQSSDIISRQAAIDALEKDKSSLDEIIKRTSSFDKQLQYFVAQHNQVESDIGAIKAQPSAEPQERTGHWIHDGSHWANRWICDKCKYKLFGVKTKFCPDCGQRMEVEHEADNRKE